MNIFLGMFLGVFLLVFIALIIPIYVCISLLLYFYNKRMYGKGTPLAWIPLLQFYLMGKYAFNEVFGVVLVFGFIFFGITFEYTFPNGDIMKYPPYDIPYASTIVFALIILCLIITIINFIQLKKGTKLSQMQIDEIKKQEEIKNKMTPEKKVITQQVLEEESKTATQTYDAALVNMERTTNDNQSINTNSQVDNTQKIACPKCGVQIKSDVAICPFCGQQIK